MPDPIGSQKANTNQPIPDLISLRVTKPVTIPTTPTDAPTSTPMI